MICIRNAKVVLENGILSEGIIVIEGDRIAAVGTDNTIDVPADAQIIDAGGAYVGPGFVDIHVHGGGGSMFHDAPEKAAHHFLSHGETTVLATLYYDLSKEQFLEAIDRIRAAMDTEAGASIGGFYMEGPYMNPKYGASADKNCWKGDIRPEDYKELVDRAGALVKVWAIAPEREGVEPFLAYARQINPTVTIAVGHS